MKDITIIMPFLNEFDEPQNTINSIYQTANPKNFEIIAIDDCSDKFLCKSHIHESTEIRFINNKERIGVDACRQMGAEMANTPFLFIIDAHMRFPLGWLPRVIDSIRNEPNTLWCTMCMGLGYGNMDLLRSRDRYQGADFALVSSKNEVLEPKWIATCKGGQYEIPCVLGANYGVSKEWFNHIHGLKGLKLWGTSELFMSLKTWMAGGSCKINTDVKIGHKFRDVAPYSTNVWAMAYNKILLCKTLFPQDLGDYLINKMPQTSNHKRALKEIESNNDFIVSEREYYKTIFKRDIYSICKQWDIAIPSHFKGYS